MSAYVIECRDKVQIPGHGWLIEGIVKEGVAFPGTDFRMMDPAGRRVLIGTVMAFVLGEDMELADYVMEGQTCGILVQYLDLSSLDVEMCTLEEL